MASSSSSVVTIGGKASSLSSASVYAISHAFSKVQIDSAALDKLVSSQSKKPSSASSKTLQNPPTSLTLTLEESRAALAVLLNKLLLSDSSTVPQNLPAQIEQTLNDGGNGTTLNLDEIDGSSVAATIGLCAVLDCCSSALVRLSDAVAALSCEAARADVAVFDLPSSGDGFANKDETDTAGDMKILLFGSKLSGKVDSEVFVEVPELHGIFRKDARDLHAATRVELNSGLRGKKAAPRAAGNHGKEKMLGKMASHMAVGVQLLAENSLGRARLAVESVADPEGRAKLVEAFDKYCPNLDEASGKFSSVRRSDYVEVVRCAYELLAKYREVLAWEAAVALFALDVDDSIERSLVGPFASTVVENGEVAKGERKKEKKKKTLGKGTSAIRQLLRERVSRSGEASGDNVAVLVEWAMELASYFDPKDAGLDTLLTRVKEIVESNEVRRLPKIPKGTRDFGKEQMAIRERAFSIITNVFKMHGAVGLDTPVFELRETLMGKYGEDSKLIYDLADQGGELCSLRYDLTVPFARYLAMNNISALKRYQIAKVYRRDNPSKGRYREFYQCDFDIAGQYKTMEPDFEVVKVLTELLDGLNIGDYEIKLNHRKLLDGMLEICGVSSEKFRTVCSSIDKLDKQSFEQIKRELVEEKGLAIETAEKIGTLVKKRGPPLEILTELKSRDSQFLENNGSVLALNELEILFRALEKANCLEKVIFDLSLARGLDYYTGVIFEAVFKGSTQVGSIAAGGRYDNLVGIFSGKQVPAVGVSLGIERVFTIMEQLEKERNQVIRATETQVLVACLGEDLLLAAELVSELWAAKIKAEFGLTTRVMNHIKRAKQSGIPWMVIVGESELKAGIVKLKNIEANEEVEVPREEIVVQLQRRLNIS